MQWANGSTISTSAEDNIDLNKWYNMATTGEVTDVDGGDHVLFMADNETSKANLQLAEIIVINQALTETQVVAASDWMTAKHGAPGVNEKRLRLLFVGIGNAKRTRETQI